MDGSRILIFLDTKKGCDQITRQLRMDSWPALSIHGDKSQAERDWVISEFKAGKSHIMTATDVAARGLDVKDVMYMINYDFPGSLEDYVHRIGRTGSEGAKGTSYTFFTAANARFTKELIAILEEAGQKVSLELSAMGRGAPPYIEGSLLHQKGRRHSHPQSWRCSGLNKLHDPISDFRHIAIQFFFECYVATRTDKVAPNIFHRFLYVHAISAMAWGIESCPKIHCPFASCLTSPGFMVDGCPGFMIDGCPYLK